MASEARSISYVSVAPGSNGTSESVAAPALSTEGPIESVARPPGALGGVESLPARAGLVSLRTRLLVFDLLAGALAWVGLGFVVTPTARPIEKLVRGATAVVVTLVCMCVARLYRSRVCVKWGNEFERIVIASLVGVFAFVGVGRSIVRPSIEDALLCGLGCAITTALLRGHYRRWLSAQHARGLYLRNVVLVGGNDDAVALWRMLSTEPELGYRVMAIIGQSEEAKPWDHLISSLTIADLPALARATSASGVLIASNALSGGDLQWAISLGSAHGLHVQVWPGLLGVGSVRLREVPVSGEPFYYVEPHYVSRWQLTVKRAIDIAGSGFCLILASPVLALAALAIKLERGGPILHRQCRVGLHGSPFTVYKLRTMTVGSETTAEQLQALNERTDGPLYKNANDPRTTKVGRLLRSLSLDELPQLWNVFGGSMSLVGPRPALPHEVVQFDDELQRRHNMRPGITGLWQAKARENPSFNAYRRFDLQYVDNWSLRLDLSILSVTIPTVAAQAVRGFRRSRSRASGRHPAGRLAPLLPDRATDRPLRRISNFPNFGDDPESVTGEDLVQREFDPA